MTKETNYLSREEMIREYFQAWLKKDNSLLEEIFAQEVVYSECYGPEYHGISQILQWFADWNRNNTVLEWPIKRFVHQENITVVEWYFRCRCGDAVDGFDGVSFVEFNESRKIISLKEFQSKAEHYYPYGK